MWRSSIKRYKTLNLTILPHTLPTKINEISQVTHQEFFKQFVDADLFQEKYILPQFLETVQELQLDDLKEEDQQLRSKTAALKLLENCTRLTGGKHKPIYKNYLEALYRILQTLDKEKKKDIRAVLLNPKAALIVTTMIARPERWLMNGIIFQELNIHPQELLLAHKNILSQLSLEETIANLQGIMVEASTNPENQLGKAQLQEQLLLLEKKVKEADLSIFDKRAAKKLCKLLDILCYGFQIEAREYNKRLRTVIEPLVPHLKSLDPRLHIAAKIIHYSLVGEPISVEDDQLLKILLRDQPCTIFSQSFFKFLVKRIRNKELKEDCEKLMQKRGYLWALPPI